MPTDTRVTPTDRHSREAEAHRIAMNNASTPTQRAFHYAEWRRYSSLVARPYRVQPPYQPIEHSPEQLAAMRAELQRHDRVADAWTAVFTIIVCVLISALIWTMP